MYAEGVAEGKGGGGGGVWERRAKQAEPSRAKPVYHSAHFAGRFLPSHPIFSPLPPVRSLVPGYIPGMLSRINNTPCLSIYFYIDKNQTALQVRILKSQSRAMSFSV